MHLIGWVYVPLPLISCPSYGRIRQIYVKQITKTNISTLKNYQYYEKNYSHLDPEGHTPIPNHVPDGNCLHPRRRRYHHLRYRERKNRFRKCIG